MTPEDIMTFRRAKERVQREIRQLAQPAILNHIAWNPDNEPAPIEWTVTMFTNNAQAQFCVSHAELMRLPHGKEQISSSISSALRRLVNSA